MSDVTAASRQRNKRDQIIAAASALIHEQGIRGMTLAEVAALVGLSTTSVTYYFKRKDQLAEACFDDTLERFRSMVAGAGLHGGGPRARITALVDGFFASYRAIRRGEEPAVARISDMRAMEEPQRSRLLDLYHDSYRTVRDLFGDNNQQATRWANTARTHVLLETLFWVQAWLPLHMPEEHDRVRHRLLDLFAQGLAPEEAAWSPSILALPALEEDGTKRDFLAAATRLINARGYRGASVDRIVAELNVTKGSFYHHLDAKDDLVYACFQRSFAVVKQAQDMAIALPRASQRDRLAAAVATLLDLQFDSRRAPLLRSVALQALPEELREQVIKQSNRLARRFAGMVIDGIIEGSIRPVDPLVASQTIMAMVNAAYELAPWAAKQPPGQAVTTYAATLFDGLFGRAG
jgi:AcrR family transcriptional regulator